MDLNLIIIVCMIIIVTSEMWYLVWLNLHTTHITLIILDEHVTIYMKAPVVESVLPAAVHGGWKVEECRSMKYYDNYVHSDVVLWNVVIGVAIWPMQPLFIQQFFHLLLHEHWLYM